jgi:hypothetical protein
MRTVERCILAAAVVGLLALWAGPAAADEEGESDEARVLVLQAVALIVNTPDDDMHMIEERIDDALEAPHKEGVDMASVERAAAAVEEGDLPRTRELLQTAIGAGPFVRSGEPKPIRETSGEPGRPAFAVGAEAGTTVVLDEYAPDRGLNGGEVVMLVLSVAVIAVGAWMAWRFRPPETVRQLRRAAVSGASEEA